jgi:hypothetical protein
MTSHLPNGYTEERARHPPAGQHDELRAMLAVIRADWRDELSNISLAALWPEISRSVLALDDTDPRRRSEAGDALLDAVLRSVEDTGRRLRACEAVEGDG